MPTTSLSWGLGLQYTMLAVSSLSSRYTTPYSSTYSLLVLVAFTAMLEKGALVTEVVAPPSKSIVLLGVKYTSLAFSTALKKFSGKWATFGPMVSTKF